MNGTTVTRLLSDEQPRDCCQQWFDDARKPNDLTSQLEALTLAIIDHDERWGRN